MKIPKTIVFIFKDCEAGQLYGLEKFWAFTKYYKHADELHIQPQLKEKLEPFNCIEDFKVLYTVSYLTNYNFEYFALYNSYISFMNLPKFSRFK